MKTNITDADYYEWLYDAMVTEDPKTAFTEREKRWFRGHQLRLEIEGEVGKVLFNNQILRVFEDWVDAEIWKNNLENL